MSLRPIAVTLYPNDGSMELSSSLSVESYIPDNGLGRIAWEIDDELTKVSPADLTVKIADDEGTVWAWLRNNLQTVRSSQRQLFPPWIVLTCGGKTLFTGLVDISSLKRNQASQVIDLSAQDWSTMLENIDLSDMTRPPARALGSRASANIGDGVQTWLLDRVMFLAVDVIVGDYLTSSVSGARNFKVLSVWKHKSFYPYVMAVELDGWAWGVYGVKAAEFTRVATDVDALPAYKVLKAVSEGSNLLELESVDGLAPGDSMTQADGSEILVGDIDPERKAVTSARSLPKISAGTYIYLSAESSDDLVHQDALRLAREVVRPYTLDATRFTPTTLVKPLFSWITNWNQSGRDLLPPSDLEPTLTALRAICEDGGYVGEPESGWTASGAWGERNVDWTCQQTTAPSSLLPDESPHYIPAGGQRNRVYAWNWNCEQFSTAALSGGRYVWSLLANVIYASRSLAWPAACMAHDYSRLRRILVTNPDSGDASYSEQRWDGTAWSAATTGTWPVAATHPCQLAPMIGVPATVGPVAPQGLAILALAVDDLGAYQLQLVWAAGTPATLAVSSTIAMGARLLTTPWGVYLVGPGGYGRITYSAGTLTLSWIAVSNPTVAHLLPSTFCAIDANTIYCFMRFDYADPDDQTSVLTETRILELSPSPVSGTDPVLFSQRVMAGAPRIARALRDPGDQTRLVGLLGARLFRISKTPAQTVTRMNVTTMTGLEALEHIAQFLNAIVIPRASGVVELVSRPQTSAATAVTVDKFEVVEARVSENFFSVVRVSSEDDSAYADAEGAVVGGASLEVSGSPTAWTEIDCYAMATNLAAFLGTPRLVSEEQWCHEDPATAPPWEDLAPWSVIAVNGGTNWFFAGLDYDLVKGETKITLLEAV